MNILLTVPKEKSMFGDHKELPDGVWGTSGHPHLGVAYLVSYLKTKGFNVRVYDHQVENSLKRLKSLIDDFKPDIVGVTAFSYSYLFVLELIDLVRSLTKVPIVVGGPHVSATKGEVLKNSKADFAIKGEGEYTFEEFLNEYLKPNPNFDDILGLIWKKNGNIVENPSRAFIKKVDTLPFPDFEAFVLEKYLCYEDRILPIISSRGCPYECTFCSVILSHGKNFRKRSPENFVDELEYWCQRGWEKFEFDDDCYSCDMKRVIKISDEIERRQLKVQYNIFNGIRVDRVSYEMLLSLKRSGCSMVSYGLESANLTILKNIKKEIKSLDQVTDAVKWARHAGLQTSVNFIIGHQGETMQTARDSLDFARKLDADFVNFYNLVPYPGTEAYEWAKRNARFLVPEEKYLQQISYRDNQPIFETDEFTAEERKMVVKEGFKIYELKVLQFRLGKWLGYLVYLLIQFQPLGKWAKWQALRGNGLVKKIYMQLSKRSREAQGY